MVAEVSTTWLTCEQMRLAALRMTDRCGGVCGEKLFRSSHFIRHQMRAVIVYVVDQFALELVQSLLPSTAQHTRRVDARHHHARMVHHWGR